MIDRAPGAPRPKKEGLLRKYRTFEDQHKFTCGQPPPRSQVRKLKDALLRFTAKTASGKFVNLLKKKRQTSEAVLDKGKGEKWMKRPTKLLAKSATLISAAQGCAKLLILKVGKELP